MCKSRIAVDPKRFPQNCFKGKCTQTYAPLGAKGYVSLPLKTAAELLQVFSLCTGRGQCCINAAPCNHIPFSSPLTVCPAGCRHPTLPPQHRAFQHTHKRPPKQLNLSVVSCFIPKYCQMKKAAWLVAHRDGQAVKVCWVIKGYAPNTVPFLLVTCRQLPTVCVCEGLTRIFGCPSGQCGGLKRSLGSLVSCLTDS